MSESVDFTKVGQKAQTPATNPSVHDVTVEDEAQARAAAIKKASSGEISWHIGKLHGDLKRAEHNVALGYADAFNGYQIAVTRRILELLGVAV